jgi:tetratricopeptide (TPR) repeat protein
MIGKPFAGPWLVALAAALCGCESATVVIDSPVRRTASDARSLYEQRQYVPAAQMFERAIDQLPADRQLEAKLHCDAGQSWWAEAAMLLTNGNRTDAEVLLERALSHYRKAAMIVPTMAAAYYGAADVVRQWGRHDLALEIIEKKRIPDRMPTSDMTGVEGTIGAAGR